MSDPVGQHLALAGPPDDVVTTRPRAGRAGTGRLAFLETFEGWPGGISGAGAL